MFVDVFKSLIGKTIGLFINYLFIFVFFSSCEHSGSVLSWKLSERVIFSWKCLTFVLQMLGQFIARAVADNILPKSFIDGYKGRVDCEYARYCVFSSQCVSSVFWWGVWCGFVSLIRAALDRAAVLLRMSRWTGLRIDSLWGSGGGQRPVNQLIKEARTHPFTAYDLT